MSSLAPDSFSGDWITPDHPDYTASIARWAANTERRALAVAFVKSAPDVALVLAHAKAHRLPFAIRGGGHSAGGASSCEGGLVIDLSRHLGGCTVDPEKRLAYVGGGALWEVVDRAAIVHGLATVAGTINHTGVGGLLLGGGYGWLTGQHGLVLDNLVQATVVTASGEILTANTNENADLFWGIRGAGSNFGCITEFVLQLHPQRRTVFAGMVIFAADALAKIMEQLAAWWEKGPGENEAVFHGMVKGPDGQPANLLIVFYNGSEEEGRAHFKPFFDLGPLVDLAREIPYEELNGIQNAGLMHGKNYYLKGVFTSGPDPTHAHALFDRVMALSAAHSIRISLVFEYLPLTTVLAVPNDATAHVRGKRVSTVAFVSWEAGGKERLGDVRAATGEIVGMILDAERGIEAGTNTGYGNYISDEPAPNTAGQAGNGSNAGPEALFGANYPRLQQIKKTYDPEMLFAKWCPIVPAA